jgi:hypothetical protein
MAHQQRQQDATPRHDEVDQRRGITPARAGQVRLLGAALLVIAVISTTTAAHPLHDHAPAQPDPARVLTTFVQVQVAARLMAGEAALAAAQRGLLAYCRVSRITAQSCASLPTADGHSSTVLAGSLARQALVLAAAGDDFSVLPLPALAPPLLIQTARLVEDLTLGTAELAGLLGDASLAVAPGNITEMQATDGELGSQVSYEPRLLRALALLRRAECWLEMLDHETGAHATLPGFEPGAISLESALAMP